MMILNILKSTHSMADSCINFTEFLLKDMTPNKKAIDKYLHESLMLVTALTPIIGYDKACQMAHYADENDLTLKDANNHYGYLSDEDLAKALDPYPMTKGGRIT